MDTTMNMTGFSDIAAFFEAQGASQAATAALTDGMVERLASTAATGLEVLDRLNDPETRAAIHNVIDGLTMLHSTGGLNTAFEVAGMFQAARAAATDDMIERLYHFLETMVTNLATREIAELARDTEMSLYDAARCCDREDGPTTIWGVIRTLSKPETIRTLNLLMAFGNCLRERTKGLDGAMEPRP